METIVSAQNPKVKRLLALREKSRDRREQGLFVVEGGREIGHCLSAGFRPETVFVCPEIYRGAAGETDDLEAAVPICRVFAVSEAVYAKMAYREGTEGIVAVFREKRLTLSDLNLPEKPLVMVLESVEKPGNLGAILRSADACSADAVIICDPLTDLYNPNVIRASIGAVFTVPVVVCTSEEAIAWLRSRGIAILTAQLQDSVLYYDTDMTGPTAIVMGTEDRGLSQPWRSAATARIRIPMLGALDSLNVSVSAAILLFEALRQRR